MIFFGWGTKTKQWKIGDKVLVLSYQYFHLFFFFTGTAGYTWQLLGDKRSEDKELTKEELEELKVHLMYEHTFEPTWWEKYSLLLLIGFFVLISL